MTNTITRCLLLSLLLSSVQGGSSKASVRSEAKAQNVTVSIRNASCKPHGKIILDWTITNSDKQPVYVYSTFLKDRAASLTPSEATFAVNAYPRAKFAELQPGAALRGHFADSPKRNPPIVGATQLAFAIAFGQRIESVQAALREGHYVHPANPIVQWQQIAKSPPVPLRGCAIK